MTIYIYLKTHKKTGYRYLGKTISKDPHAYPGSGKLWKRHLNKHGYDYTTEILATCATADEVREIGLLLSDQYNIVEDASFANLMVEAGDGGATRGTGWHLSEGAKEKLRNRVISEIYRERMRIAQQKRAPQISEEMKAWHKNPENYAKKIETMKSGCQSEESRLKRNESLKKLKWCNDGTRNYRLSQVPSEYSLGRLSL